MLVALDLALALGACLRLTRFIVADDVPGDWWIKAFLYKRATAALSWKSGENAPKWINYLDGLNCPFCVSVWFSAFVTVTLAIAGGPGDAADWWRYPAGFLTLAWLTGHIAKRAGDTAE